MVWWCVRCVVPNKDLRNIVPSLLGGHKFQKARPTQGGKEINHMGLPVSGSLERVEPIGEMGGGA